MVLSKGLDIEVDDKYILPEVLVFDGKVLDDVPSQIRLRLTHYQSKHSNMPGFYVNKGARRGERNYLEFFLATPMNTEALCPREVCLQPLSLKHKLTMK